MTKQELIKKLAHTLTYQGWGVSFDGGNGADICQADERRSIFLQKGALYISKQRYG